jgi:hypothetical protein
MRREHEVIRFLLAQQEAWHGHFPGLTSRAQQLIVDYLCTKGRTGALVRQLYGVTKEMFLLDDATVRDRIAGIQRLGLCVTDPPDGRLTGRTLIAPTPSLVARHEEYLHALAERLCASAAVMEPGAFNRGPVLAEQHRAAVLRLMETGTDAWLGAADALMAAASLSPARRAEARRHLMSTSHWTLLNRAIEHSHAERDGGVPPGGLVADQLAAAVLDLTGQSFQTTRDHITYLIGLGLLERRAGKALRVALAAHAAPFFDRMLANVAADLVDAARKLGDAQPCDAQPGDTAEPAGGDEETIMRRPVPAPAPPESAHFLVLAGTSGNAREVRLGPAPVTFGRVAPCDVMLPGGEVSRSHCEARITGGAVHITDLRSTNGTFVNGSRIAGTAILPAGGSLHIGPYLLVHEMREVHRMREAGRDDDFGTIRMLPVRKNPLPTGP